MKFLKFIIYSSINTRTTACDTDCVETGLQEKQPTGAAVRPVLFTAQQHQARARHVTTFQPSHVTETPLTALLSNLSAEIITVNVDVMMTGLRYRLQYQPREFWRLKRAPSLWKYEDL